MAERTRNHKYTLYLNDEEERILEGKARFYNQRSKADMLRRLIIESVLYEIDYSELSKYNMELHKIGTNINQIAKRINETRSIYKADIEKLQEEMEQIWQLQKSMLSKQPLREQ